MLWTVKVLVLSLLCAVSRGDVESSQRDKRTVGFLFRGLVDAATRTTPAPTPSPAQYISITTPPPPPPLAPEKVKQPPRPMIYIIPVGNRSPHHNEINDLAEVLRFVKAPVKIKNENGSADPDLKALIQATKQLTLDKRNASYKEEDDKAVKNGELEPATEEETPKKEQRKQFAIKIQAPREENNSKHFTIKIEGDNVRVKKTKDGYSLKFSLPDKEANIRIEYPQKQFEKQEVAPQPQSPQNPFFYNPAQFGFGQSPYGPYQGAHYHPYHNQFFQQPYPYSPYPQQPSSQRPQQDNPTDPQQNQQNPNYYDPYKQYGTGAVDPYSQFSATLRQYQQQFGQLQQHYGAAQQQSQQPQQPQQNQPQNPQYQQYAQNFGFPSPYADFSQYDQPGAYSETDRCTVDANGVTNQRCAKAHNP